MTVFLVLITSIGLTVIPAPYSSMDACLTAKAKWESINPYFAAQCFVVK